MTTILTTPRLALRCWEEADLDALAGLNSPAVMRYLGPVPTRAEQMAMIRRQQALQADHGHCFWVVERRADGAFLGFCGMKRVNAAGTTLTGQHEIGWRLREDAWGQGYAREAATASLVHAFGPLAAPEVVAFTVIGNRASWGLMERLGMTRTASLDFVDPRYGADLNPTIVYRIEARAWTA